MAHQCHRAGEQWAPGRRRIFRWHARELRELAGQGAAAELREQVRGDEDALVAMEADCRSGRRLTGDYLSGLARRIPDFEETVPLPEHTGDLLAEAAAVETHPVIRAAHLHLTCEETLRRVAQRDGLPGPPLSLRPLPWALASLSLLRSTYPPLIMDHRLVEAHRAARSQPTQWDRLTALVPLFADLETVSLRSELSWAAPLHADPDQRSPVSPGAHFTVVRPRPAPLMAALHRRILERLRFRSASFTLVLRELDPAAQADVTAGDIETAPQRNRCEAAAARALFRLGPGCRWASLDIAATEARLRLLVLVQDVGAPPTGALAVTADAWLTVEDRSIDVLDPAYTDSVTLVPTDGADDRRSEVEGFVDDVVARALDRLTRALS